MTGGQSAEQAVPAGINGWLQGNPRSDVVLKLAENLPSGHETVANVLAWFGDDRQTESIFDAGLAVG